jgi:hypothetical protein
MVLLLLLLLLLLLELMLCVGARRVLRVVVTALHEVAGVVTRK